MYLLIDDIGILSELIQSVNIHIYGGEKLEATIA